MVFCTKHVDFCISGVDFRPQSEEKCAQETMLERNLGLTSSLPNDHNPFQQLGKVIKLLSMAQARSFAPSGKSNK